MWAEVLWQNYAKNVHPVQMQTNAQCAANGFPEKALLRESATAAASAAKRTNALNAVNRYRYSEKAQPQCFATGVQWVQRKTLVFFAEKGCKPIRT